MTRPLLETNLPFAAPHLAPGEQALDALPVIPVEGAKGIGGGVGAVVGNELSQAGSVRGGPGTIASTFPVHRLPRTSVKLLFATDRRLLLLVRDPGGRNVEFLWHTPRSSVLGVRRTMRLQALARFRLHFADDSSVALFTLRKRNVVALAAAIGTFR